MSINKKQMDADVSIKTALAPNVVGYCVKILEDYLSQNNDEGTLKGFEQYYIKTQGKEGLLKASDIIASKGYTLEQAKQYVYIRVFTDTWNGKYWEVQVKKEMLSKGFKMAYSTTEEDYKYCVDLIGDTFAIQVKPISYFKGTNPSLMIDKKRHKQAQLRYQQQSGKVVCYAFYDNRSNTITYKSNI
jgi:hypothetical protein